MQLSKFIKRVYLTYEGFRILTLKRANSLYIVQNEAIKNLSCTLSECIDLITCFLRKASAPAAGPNPVRDRPKTE